MKYKMRILLSFLILLSATSCTQQNSSFNGQDPGCNLPLGTYILDVHSNGDPIEFIPSLNIIENNRFTFCYSVLSSTILNGTYEIENGQLILNAELPDDYSSTYIFDIDGNDLIFNSTSSDPLFPELGTDKITSGTPFILLYDS